MSGSFLIQPDRWDHQVAGYGLSRSLVEIDEKDNEFRFSIDDVQPVPTPVSVGRPLTDLQKEK